MRISHMAILGMMLFLGGALLSAAPVSGPGTATSPVTTRRTRPPQPTDQPARNVINSDAHRKLVEKAKKGGIDLYFEGDNILAGWESFSKANWDKNFSGFKPGNFALDAERTQNILFRIGDGELDGVNPKVIVLMAGGSNIQPGASDSATQDIARGVRACIDAMHTKAPDAKFVLVGITPRNSSEFNAAAKKINVEIAKFADDKELTIKFVDVSDKLVDKNPSKNGNLQQDLSRDGAMLSDAGFQILADALKPILTEWLTSPKWGS